MGGTAADTGPHRAGRTGKTGGSGEGFVCTGGPAKDKAYAEEAAAKTRAEDLAVEQRILRRQIEKRFGPVNEAIATRIAATSQPVIEDLSLRLLDAATLDELFS